MNRQTITSEYTLEALNGYIEYNKKIERIPKHLTGHKKTITGIKPEKKEHKLYITRGIDECGFGWEWFTDDEYYRDIIVDGNRYYKTRNYSHYRRLYEEIMLHCINYYELQNELEDIELKSEYSRYKNATEAINDYLPVKANKYQVYRTKKALKESRNDDELIAELMSIFTPYTWKWYTMRGYCQGDWNDALYPVEKYSQADIEKFEAFYFGMYGDYEFTYKGESVNDFITDDEAYNVENVYKRGFDIFGIKNMDKKNIIYNDRY